VKIAANVSSFALYTSLGFLPVDCWTAFEGCVTSEQAAFASHSIGYQPPTGNYPIYAQIHFFNFLEYFFITSLY